jgi:hypothetical protein
LDADRQLYRIVQHETAIEGTAVNGSDLSLPPGRYRVEAPDRPGTAVEFEVKANETKEPSTGSPRGNAASTSECGRRLPPANAHRKEEQAARDAADAAQPSKRVTRA